MQTISTVTAHSILDQKLCRFKMAIGKTALVFGFFLLISFVFTLLFLNNLSMNLIEKIKTFKELNQTILKRSVYLPRIINFHREPES